jgi:hypothetical protein
MVVRSPFPSQTWYVGPTKSPLKRNPLPPNDQNQPQKKKRHHPISLTSPSQPPPAVWSAPSSLTAVEISNWSFSPSPHAIAWPDSSHSLFLFEVLFPPRLSCTVRRRRTRLQPPESHRRRECCLRTARLSHCWRTCSLEQRRPRLLLGHSLPVGRTMWRSYPLPACSPSAMQLAMAYGAAPLRRTSERSVVLCPASPPFQSTSTTSCTSWKGDYI